MVKKFGGYFSYCYVLVLSGLLHCVTVQPPVQPLGPGTTTCSRDVSSAIKMCQMTYRTMVVSVNISYDANACSILQSANTTLHNCLSQQLLLDSNCSSLVETAIATDSLLTSVTSALEICECPGSIIGVLNTTKHCLLSTATYSYNAVCRSINSYMNCMADSIDACPALLDILEPVLDAIALSDVLYGCTVNINNHMYQPTGCDYKAIIECYNPMLAATFGQEFNTDTEWQTFVEQISNVYTEVTNITIECIDIPNLNSMTNCARNYQQNCYGVIYMSELDFSGGKPWSSWRSHVSDLSVADVIPKAIDVTEAPVVSGSLLAYYVYLVVYAISEHCQTDCANYEERLANYSKCEALYTSDLFSVMRAVLEQYSQSGGYTTSPSSTSDCMILKNVSDCSTQFFTGCGYRQRYSTIYNLHRPTRYAAASICDAHFTFSPRWAPVGMCDTPELVNNELKFMPSICHGNLIQTADFSKQLTTPEQICSAYQEQADCYTRVSVCCESRKQLLAPLMHTWAMINEKLPGCTVYLTDFDKLKVLPIQTAVSDSGVSCSYDQVFSCYNDFLQKATPIPLSAAELTTLTSNSLRQLYSIRDSIMQAPATTCPSESEISAAETCLRQFANKCTFPELCDTGSLPDTMRSLPLAEILLVDVKDICTEACKTVDSISVQTAISDCTRQHVRSGDMQKLANTIVWNIYTGGQNTEQCSQMVDTTNCIRRSVGNCTAYEDILKSIIAPDDSVMSRAMLECNASFQAMVATTTTQRTQGATKTSSRAILIFLSALATVIMTI